MKTFIRKKVDHLSSGSKQIKENLKQDKQS